MQEGRKDDWKKEIFKKTGKITDFIGMGSVCFCILGREERDFLKVFYVSVKHEGFV